MRTLLSVLILSFCAISQQASAATVVIAAEGFAKSCYLAAAANNVRSINLCDRALSEALTSRDRAATLINRSALKIQLGDMQGGLADCEKSISTHEGLAEAYLNRGVALRALGHAHDAIGSLTKSIEIGGIKPELAYYDRAMAEEDAGDIASAYHDYKHALQTAPDFKAAAEELKRFKVTAGT